MQTSSSTDATTDYRYFLVDSECDYVRGVYDEDEDYLYFQIVWCLRQPDAVGARGVIDRPFVAQGIKFDLFEMRKRNPRAVELMLADFTDAELERMTRALPALVGGPREVT